MVVYGLSGHEELYHLKKGEAAANHKYISRRYSNGRWQYTYANRKTVKRVTTPKKRKSSVDKTSDRVVRNVSVEVDMYVSDAAIAKRYYRGITKLYDLINTSSGNISYRDIRNAKDALYLLEDLDEEISDEYGLGLDFNKIDAVRKYIDSKYGLSGQKELYHFAKVDIKLAKNQKDELKMYLKELNAFNDHLAEARKRRHR